MMTIDLDDPLLRVFRNSLQELGYVEGRNVRFVHRSAYGQLDRLPALAEELAQLNVDVILASPDPAALAAKRAVTTVPIVMICVATDPVASGLIDSLRRPGGNVTGVYARQPELVAKRLELLRETLPGLARIAVLYDALGAQSLTDLRSAAHLLKIEVVPVELKAPYNLRGAFHAARRANVGALLTLYSIPLYQRREEIARFALDHRLPTIAQFEQFTRAGGLMSYGVDIDATFARTAYFVDRLLRGDKPSELPVEQTSTFKLALNLRTAKSLRIQIPQSILVRADEVIQ